MFGAGGEIFFLKEVGSSAFLYRVRQDGGGLRQALDLPNVDVHGVSGDRQTLLLGAPAGQPGFVLLPVNGGPALRLPPPQAGLRWSGDGKYLFVEHEKTLAVPLSTGRLFPESFAKGVPSDEEITKLPGVRLIPADDVTPGPTADVYAFTRRNVQRNLYRIPVP